MVVGGPPPWKEQIPLLKYHSSNKALSPWLMTCSHFRSCLLTAWVCCQEGFETELLWGHKNTVQGVFEHLDIVFGKEMTARGGYGEEEGL
jgi:hypothetical protein